MNPCKRCGFSLWPGLVACPSCGTAISTTDNDSMVQVFPGMGASTPGANPYMENARTLYAPQGVSGQSFADDSTETQFADYGMSVPGSPQSIPSQQPLFNVQPPQQTPYFAGQA